MAEQISQQEMDLNYVISDLNSRLRNLENRYNLLAERLIIVNKNMIDEYKKLLKEIKASSTDTKDIKLEIFKIKNLLKELTTELEFFAKKDQLKALEKYISMWDPMNFVTEEEVEKLVETKMEVNHGK